MSDINEKRVAKAIELGASEGFVVSRLSHVEKEAERLVALFGCAPDLAIECSGAEASTSLAIKTVASGGRVMLVGIGAGDVKVPLVDAICKELTINTSLRYANW